MVKRTNKYVKKEAKRKRSDNKGREREGLVLW